MSNPDDPCASHAFVARSRGEHLALVLALDGGLLAGLLLAVVGGVRGRALPLVAGAAVLVAPALPLTLGFSGYAVLLSSALLVVAALAQRAFAGGVLLLARSLAALVGAGALVQLVAAVRAGSWPFLLATLALLALPAGMAWAVWRPPPDPQLPT